MNETDYKREFGIDPPNDEIRSKALEHALDIRKFEIELYWKRATYFWTLIAVTFAGYFAVLSSEKLQDKEYLAYIISCVGLVFTWAWFLVNRGSKYWQENWENHVNMLEDKVTGPLYKTVLFRPPDEEICEKFFTGPWTISVSKTNQWVSTFTLCIWIALIFHALPELKLQSPLSFKHLIIGGLTLGFCRLMCWKGKSYDGVFEHFAKKIESKIIERNDRQNSANTPPT